MSTPIKSYSIEEIKDLVRSAGLPSFRSGQLLSWIYGKNVDSYDEMSNIPKTVREQFKEEYPLFKPKVKVRLVSKDGSRKYLLLFNDGTSVETVGLPAEGRLTVCCSTQSGCAMGCVFCATGKMGLKRNLLPGEIVDQVLTVQEDFGERVSNVVLMGQGEPFMNYDSTLAALKIMNDKKLLNIGSRHITVSTCGIVSAIERFSNESGQFTLAVSLHSARQEVRDHLMPAVKNQRLEDLHRALKAYSDKTGRRVTLEYALMKGINDSEEDKEALISFCGDLLCHVNMIPLNEVKGSEFLPLSRAAMEKWRESLERRGIPSTVRNSRGGDIDAACGQLSSRYMTN